MSPGIVTSIVLQNGLCTLLKKPKLEKQVLGIILGQMATSVQDLCGNQDLPILSKANLQR